LLLGVACILTGIVFLLSLGIAMPFLAEQFQSWLKTGHWGDVPLVITPHPSGVIGLIADLLLSWGPSLLILTAAGLFGVLVWIFEAARSRLISYRGASNNNDLR
jgi:hypothetical protein